MKKYNMFIEKETAENAFLRAIKKIESYLDFITLAINENKTYLKKDSYQLIANLMIAENSFERVLFSELLTLCFQLELKCHGSCIYFLRAFASFAKDYHQKENITYYSVMEHNQIEGKKYFTKILSSCYPATQGRIDQLIRENTNDLIIESTIKEAIALAGIEGNIVIEEANIENNIVELDFGYNFPSEPFKGFVGDNTWTRRNVKILLIDGLIDRVSEIDKILIQSFETKIPLLIVAQGFSEEVIATIYTNTSRGNFDVMPLRLQQSLESLNILNDIAVVSGCDVLSTLKGEMISCVKYENLPLLQKASITNKILTIENSSTRLQVLNHLNYLNSRRKEQSSQSSITDLADLTTKRIQNLLSHIVKIKIPLKKAANQKAFIDNAIRACRTAFTYGFINPEKVDLNGLDKIWTNAHYSMIKKEKIENIPSISFYLATGYASKIASLYFTSSGMLINQQ